MFGLELRRPKDMTTDETLIASRPPLKKFFVNVIVYIMPEIQLSTSSSLDHFPIRGSRNLNVIIALHIAARSYFF